MHPTESCLTATQTCHNIKGTSEEKNKMLASEALSRNIKALPQTPPLAIVTPARHQSRPGSCTYTQRAQSKQLPHQINRPATVINAKSEKMLALPIPTVRAVDLNSYREPGYMGINPITLRGETGMLPGRWGEGKEFMNKMAWLGPRRQPPGQVGAARWIKETMLQQPQQVSGRTVMNMNELRAKYAQAILDGHACAESNMEDTAPLAAMKKPMETCPAEQGDTEVDGYDWEDISDDEEIAIEGRNEPDQKRDDSGYFSGETDATLRTSQAKPPVPRRKMVRFDEQAIQKQVRSKANLAVRSGLGKAAAGHRGVG